MNRTMYLVFGAALALGLAGTLVLTGSPAEAACDKLTICHAAGKAGTTKFVEVTACENAITGRAGHFFEDGTPQAGHEDDIFGPCEKTEPPKVTEKPTPI